MATLSWAITLTTRINTLTATSVTTKTLIATINGETSPHRYVFANAVTDEDAKASAKADLEGPKGYGVLTE